MCPFWVRELNLTRLRELETLNIQLACEIDIERIGEQLVLHLLLQMAKDLLFCRECEGDSLDIGNSSLLHVLNNVVANTRLIDQHFLDMSEFLKDDADAADHARVGRLERPTLVVDELDLVALLRDDRNDRIIHTLAEIDSKPVRAARSQRPRRG